MRLSSFVVSLVDLLQHLVSIWFLYDFFLTRDSITLNTLRQSNDQELDHGLSQLVDRLDHRHCRKEAMEKPIFDKLVFIVIDALGSEFLATLEDQAHPQDETNQGMMFTEGLARNDLAMSYVAVAASPTVTMPRIKALLSGTVPSFADIMFNLASDVSKFDDENLLQLARAKNKSIVFYGDDTWLSLFDRSIFKRHKETLSFFASDYTSVDTNVTELAIPETNLEHIDWDLLILHYLGLDHIGHIFGSNKHPLIRTKLEEMDSVVEKIHGNMLRKNETTLIVICGDHGMSRSGNHGGDTSLETRTALMFIPVNRIFHGHNKSNGFGGEIRQIDIATTLSLLMGFDPPKASRGVLIESVLRRLMTDQEFYCACLKNLLQLVKFAGATDNVSKDTYNAITSLLNQHLNQNNDEIDLNIMSSSYMSKSQQIQRILLQTVTSAGSNPLIVLALSSVILLTLVRIRRASIRLLMPVLSRQERYACLIALLFPILMQGSTDFIELEHLYWAPYSLLVAGLLIGYAIMQLRGPIKNDIDTLKASILIITSCLTYSWNNFGLGEAVGTNTMIGFFALALLCNFTRQNSDMPRYRGQLAMLVCCPIVILGYWDYLTPMHVISRENMECLALLVVLIHSVANLINTDILKDRDFAIYCSKIAVGWILVAFLLSRPSNFFLLSTNIIMEISVNNLANSLRLAPISRVIMYTFFAQSAFFNQGNTNLFSSIDVKASVYGQSQYNLKLAIALVSMATYSTQIYWIVKMFQRTQSDKCADPFLSSSEPDKIEAPTAETSVNGLVEFLRDYNFLSLSYYMFVCLVLRNHLFIWSVISPKLVFHYMTNLMILMTTMIVSRSYKLIRRVRSRQRPSSSALLKDAIL